jgi:hypothetical protein
VYRDGRKRTRGGGGTDFDICRQLSEQKLVCEQSPRHGLTPQGLHIRKQWPMTRTRRTPGFQKMEAIMGMIMEMKVEGLGRTPSDGRFRMEFV